MHSNADGSRILQFMEHDTKFGIENDTWPSQVYSVLPEYRLPTHSVLSVSPFQSLHDLLCQDVMN